MLKIFWLISILALHNTPLVANEALSGLNSFYIEAITDSESKAAGFSEKQILKLAQKKAIALGIDIQKTDTKPKLTVSVQTLKVSKKVKTTSVILTLQEWARLGRAPQYTHFVTTWSSNILLAASPRNIASETKRSVGEALEDFLSAFEKANPTAKKKK